MTGPGPTATIAGVWLKGDSARGDLTCDSTDCDRYRAVHSHNSFQPQAMRIREFRRDAGRFEGEELRMEATPACDWSMVVKIHMMPLSVVAHWSRGTTGCDAKPAVTSQRQSH